MMDAPAIQAAENAVHAGYSLETAAALVVELDGSEADCDEQFVRVRELWPSMPTIAPVPGKVARPRSPQWA